jgi:hypothetical protein
MFSDLRTDLNRPQLPIVIGQLGEFLTVEKYPFVEGVRAAIHAIPKKIPHVGFADSKDLGHKGDGLHFSAEAEQELGLRFAQAMQTLQK